MFGRLFGRGRLRLEWTVGPVLRDSPDPVQGGTAMPFVLHDDQTLPLRLNAADKHGHVPTLDGLTWTVSDPEILTVAVQGDGTRVVVKPAGKLGEAVVTLNLPAAPGRKPLRATFPVVVVAGEVTTFEIVPDAALSLEKDPA